MSTLPHVSAVAALPTACARTACGAAGGRRWWNKSTRAYYCTPCARLINDGAPGLCVQVVDLSEWPYGPPDHHESCCVLFQGERECDCKASDASDTEWGTAS